MTLLMFLLLACAGDPAAPSSDSGGDAPPAWSDPATCAEDVALGSVDGLQRWPYLQDVRTDRATLLFGTDLDIDDGAVRISRDGSWDEARATTVSPLRIDDSDDDDTGGPVEEIALHRVDLTGLQPGTEYCYQVEAGGQVLASGIRFWTAPDPAADATVRFMVIGDMGAGTEEQALVRDVMLRHAEGVHFVLTTGDNAYGDGDWDELHTLVFQPYQELFARAPVYPTAGNHDYKTEHAQPYLDNFVLPENILRSSDAERYYSMTWGPMYWAGLDTEWPIYEIREDETDDMLDWLEQDLAESDRPWKVAGWHQPAYSGHPTRGIHIPARLQLVPALEAAGVQLVLQGHDHFYERFQSLREDQPATLAEGGIAYIVTAGGGQSLYEIDTTEPWLEVAELRHHFLLGEADGCTLRLQAIDVYDTVFDELVLDRCEG